MSPLVVEAETAVTDVSGQYDGLAFCLDLDATPSVHLKRKVRCSPAYEVPREGKHEEEINLPVMTFWAESRIDLGFLLILPSLLPFKFLFCASKVTEARGTSSPRQTPAPSFIQPPCPPQLLGLPLLLQLVLLPHLAGAAVTSAPVSGGTTV